MILRGIKNKKAKLFAISFFICLVAIEFLATTSQEIKPIQNSWDKANHFIAFFDFVCDIVLWICETKNTNKSFTSFGIWITNRNRTSFFTKQGIFIA